MTLKYKLLYVSAFIFMAVISACIRSGVTHIENPLTISWKHGELIIGDNEFTWTVLDYLTTPSLNDEDALNDSVFGEICKKADGALSEIMGEYIFKGIKSKPGFIERLTGNEAFIEEFCFYIGEEAYWEYFFNCSSEIQSRKTDEDVFNDVLRDLQPYINEREYDILLGLKPKILKSVNLHLQEK